MKLYSSRCLSALLLVATLTLALAAGCWRRSDPLAPPKAAPPAALAVFVGSAACVECHPAECKAQNSSRHARTLSAMSPDLAANLAPPTGVIPGTGFAIAHVNDRFFIQSATPPPLAVPLDYEFGSGKTGVTYTFVMSDARLIELRSSYFPHFKKWYVTPGQEHLRKEDVGGVFPPAAARECFLCHAITVPDGMVTPQKPFFGVGCEACHGPGSVHIATVQAGNDRASGRESSRTASIGMEGTRGMEQSSGMEAIAHWPATRINQLCGRCHGTEQEVRQQGLSPGMITRFQSVGLMRSQCFRQSKDTLSCLTCHDPHTDVSTNTPAYEAICLRCHAASNSAQRPPALQSATIKPCPVNPRSKCIGCHMPKRPAILSARMPTLMSEHRIGLYGGLR